MIKNRAREINTEIKRKGIHIISTIIPILYYYISKEQLLILVGTGTILMILIDLIKKDDNLTGRLYKKYFYNVLRNNEKDFTKRQLTGGTYYAIGIFLAILLFNKPVASLAMLIMIWGDTNAAIIGKTFGKYFIYKKKTLEGSISFLITSIIVLIILQNIYSDFNMYKAGFITVFIVTFIELYNFKINDNLLLPVSAGSIFYLINQFL